jgi:ribosomal-protein-alanine N-acetyltransferase
MNLPPYAVFPELRSAELLLREIRMEDVSSLLEALTYDGKTAATLEEGIQIVERTNQNYLDGNSVNWVIENNETNELMGFIGYYRGFENGVGEVGFVLKAAFRGLGFMSTSLQMMVDFGLNNMVLNGVVAFTKPDNEKAITVLSQNGFHENKPEGAYLKFVYSAGK